MKETNRDDYGTLSALTLADAEQVVSWVTTKPDAVQFAGDEVPWPLSAAGFLAQCERRGYTPYGLRDKHGSLVATGSIRSMGDPGVLRVGQVLVSASQRGLGWGRAVMQHLVGVARGDDACSVIELSVYRFNTAARNLYTQFGFEPTGQHTSCVVNGQTWVADTLRLVLPPTRARHRG